MLKANSKSVYKAHMRQEEDRREDAAAYEAEMRRLARLEQLREPEPEGITPEQMEYIRDARTKLYWIYKTRNMKELEVDVCKVVLMMFLRRIARAGISREHLLRKGNDHSTTGLRFDWFRFYYFTTYFLVR